MANHTLTTPAQYIDGKRIPDPEFLQGWIVNNKARQSKHEQARRAGKQKQLHDGLHAIPLALDWLNRHGLDVIAYENGDFKQPSITVKYGPACQILKAYNGAYHYQSRRTQGKAFRCWRAELMGCYINWSEGMN